MNHLGSTFNHVLPRHWMRFRRAEEEWGWEDMGTVSLSFCYQFHPNNVTVGKFFGL